MRALPVVKDLDVFEDLGASALAGLEGPVADQFLLHRGEEALGDSVVPARPPAAEGENHPVILGQPTEVPAGVLTAPVGAKPNSV